MGVPGLPDPLWSRRRLRRLWIQWLRKLLYASRGLTGPGPINWHSRRFGSKDYQGAGELRSVLVRVVNEDLSESARSAGCPVLLLWGAEDADAPPSLAIRFQQLMHGRASLVILPHKDHHLQTGTGAHLCGLKIREWMQAQVDA